jgi:hypothetical protein
MQLVWAQPNVLLPAGESKGPLSRVEPTKLDLNNQQRYELEITINMLVCMHYIRLRQRFACFILMARHCSAAGHAPCSLSRQGLS